MGRPSRVRATGPLASHALGFRRELALQGYTLNSASDQLTVLASKIENDNSVERVMDEAASRGGVALGKV